MTTGKVGQFRQQQALQQVPNGKRILVIEPSRTIRGFLAVYLQEAGHQLIMFEDYQTPAQMLPAFQAQPPELAFVALRTTRAESFRIIDLLRRQFTHMTLIIMMAQEESREYAVQRLLDTAQAVPLLKPFRIKDVFSLIAAAGQATYMLSGTRSTDRQERA
ncbi:MAG: response regulator [Chloroflexi bacterium]|nr:response regulator [Ktedonobacteraceae bacterium]MBV8821336.1 response regulator [Ktedonobacteraceae bacterium]MBV9021718.1 response regulator [Ktedonobacteraceae bacterium]MBV9707704.1 response regulator [Chloroflexota bacterium]